MSQTMLFKKTHKFNFVIPDEEEYYTAIECPTCKTPVFENWCVRCCKEIPREKQ
jgi:hypothetical protein